MRGFKLLFLFAINFVFCSVNAQKQNNNLKLWYNKPASVWEEALPLGNGKTGAMIFGGIAKERFQLNDNTLWSGAPNPGNTPEGPTILPQIRKQVFEGNYDSAATLWRKMHGPYSARYLPMADLWLTGHSKDSTTSSYYRDLDLDKAPLRVGFGPGVGAILVLPGRRRRVSLLATRRA